MDPRGCHCGRGVFEGGDEVKESAAQRSVIRWWEMQHKGLGIPDSRLLFHIPNGAFLGGGKLGAMRGARLRSEGMREGVPDLFLAVPTDVLIDGVPTHAGGLFIEMKRDKGGRESAAQKSMREALNAQGYVVVVCHGWEKAVEVITHYLSARPRA